MEGNISFRIKFCAFGVSSFGVLFFFDRYLRVNGDVTATNLSPLVSRSDGNQFSCLFITFLECLVVFFFSVETPRVFFFSPYCFCTLFIFSRRTELFAAASRSGSVTPLLRDPALNCRSRVRFPPGALLTGLTKNTDRASGYGRGKKRALRTLFVRDDTAVLPLCSWNL